MKWIYAQNIKMLQKYFLKFDLKNFWLEETE